MAYNRNVEVDILKGVAMLLMILGHMPIPNIAKNFIFSFHMPLFFFISGYLYKDKSFITIVKNNTRKILLPYLFTCLLVWGYKCIEGDYAWGISIVLANGSYPVWQFYDYYVGPLWFLVCYFMASIGFKLMRKPNTIIVFLSMLSLWIVAIIYKKHFNLLPLDLLNAIPAILCMELGNQMKESKWSEILHNHYVLTFGILIWSVCAIFGNVSMASLVYKFWFLQIIGAFFGTLIIYYVIVKLRKAAEGSKIWDFLSFTGQISLVIVCAHSIDYLLCITPKIADFLFDVSMARNVALFFFKFLFVYIVYLLFKYIPLTKLVFKI